MVDRGVVDEDVDAAQLCHDTLGHRLDGAAVGDVDLDGDGAPAAGRDLLGDPVALRFRPADDGGAGRRQGRADTRPETASAAGDDGDAPRQREGIAGAHDGTPAAAWANPTTVRVFPE